MKVSIIIPVYNVEPYVERCLQSVMAQTYKGPLECILVDDCGKDRSMDVAVEYINRNVNDNHNIEFVFLHHERNRGLSAARNTGMTAATGDYLFFLDSDDEISDDCIEKLASPLTEERYDLVVGNIDTIGNDSLGKLLNLKLNDGEVLKGKMIMDAYRCNWNMIVPNKLYRTAFIREHGLQFKEGLVHEDELWSFQVACLAQSLKAVNRKTYIYYIRENSITISVNAKQRKREALKNIVAEMRNFLIERHIFSASAYRLVQYFSWRILKSTLNNRSQFIQDYCQLRQITHFPLSYRIKAKGLHLRAQLNNLYYIMPSKTAASIIYWRKHSSFNNHENNYSRKR